MRNLKIGTIISVFFFGILGGILRYWIGIELGVIGTVLVNIIGSFCLAFLTYFVIEREKLPVWLSTGLGTGLIGAFTTFSTFTIDFVSFDRFSIATIYLLTSAIVGIFAAYTGTLLGLILGRRKI